MFDERDREDGMEVWQSPKYQATRKFAIDLINSKKYNIEETDFWILKNKTKTGKMMYSGLIISHNGCLKINDNLENKFDPKCVTLDKEGYGGSLVFTYCDDEVYEVGEVAKNNCMNSYPYAMASKRCFDRVVLKKSKLAFYGVYSDSEAEEFRSPDDIAEERKESGRAKIEAQKNADKPITKKEEAELVKLIENIEANSPLEERIKGICGRYGIGSLSEMKKSQYTHCVNMLSKVSK